MPEEQNEPFSLGAENGEYCQLREYQEGDPSRKIHWKKSAEGNQLWVREYGTEQEFLRLILDFRGFHQRSADEISAFYELLYSLLTGLLAENCLIAVSWLIGTGEEQQFSIHRQEDMDELLWILYRQEPLFDFGQNKTRRVTSAEAGEELCLDAELRLYRQGKLIGSFSIPEIREGRVSVYLQGEER